MDRSIDRLHSSPYHAYGFLYLLERISYSSYYNTLGTSSIKFVISG